MTINALSDGKAFSRDDEMPERAPRQFDPRTRHLIEAPITPTLLRLAAPNVLVMVVQASVGLIETYFVGKLGTDALAGVALVFPALMLMQMMSAGAMGGGISSAIGARSGPGAAAMPMPWRCTRLPSPLASGLFLPPRCSPAGHGSTPQWVGEAHRSMRR